MRSRRRPWSRTFGMGATVAGHGSRPDRHGVQVRTPWWSWRESNPRPSSGCRPCYDHSRGCASTASASPGRLPFGTAGSFSDARGLCLRSAVSPAVHHYFCCRAVVVWPRASFLITMTLFARRLGQAARANCSLAILVVPRLASLSNSGRMNGFRSRRRNRSAPCQ